MANGPGLLTPRQVLNNLFLMCAGTIPSCSSGKSFETYKQLYSSGPANAQFQGALRCCPGDSDKSCHRASAASVSHSRWRVRAPSAPPWGWNVPCAWTQRASESPCLHPSWEHSALHCQLVLVVPWTKVKEISGWSLRVKGVFNSHFSDGLKRQVGNLPLTPPEGFLAGAY